MKNGRFEIIFGLIFAGVGFLITGVCLHAMLTNSGAADNPAVGIFMGLIFGVVGLIILFVGLKSAMKAHRAFTLGRHYPAKIVQYEADERTRINDQPVLLLVVRYYPDGGGVREAIVSTGGINMKKFPIGGTVEVAEHEGSAYLVSKMATMDALPGESALMNPQTPVTDPSGADRVGAPLAIVPSGPNISVACPNCGTVFSIPPGSSVSCGCGRSFTLTQDHMIV